jgi:CDC45-like protein
MCEESNRVQFEFIIIKLILCYLSEFGLAFLRAKETCNTVTRHSSFDASVLEIEQKDLKTFLSTLCEDPNEPTA